MAQPPFINSTGLIGKIFGKIAEAQKPERFTQDYLANVLGFGSGSARPIIGLLKRIGFLQSDGTPTPLYARFRNETERPSAMLEALKIGYPTLYARSEYAHTMQKDKLRQLVIEVTGLEPDSETVRAIVSSFEALKAVGGVNDRARIVTESVPARPKEEPNFETRNAVALRSNGEEVGLNLSYTINLNLPPSTDPDVFNAIFRALKEHLLGK